MHVATQASEAKAVAPPAREGPTVEDGPRLFTVDEFHRMCEAGVFDDDERVELLEGSIVVMSGQNPPHAGIIQRLTQWLILQLGGAYSVRCQLPVMLGGGSEPVPDLAVAPADGRETATHPGTALLVIEVSDTTLRKDRGPKLALYARFGIPEYWIVNVKNSTVEVYRDPDPEAGRYRTMLTLSKDASLSPTSVPGVTISLAELFA